jgi:hypothetical protein
MEPMWVYHNSVFLVLMDFIEQQPQLYQVSNIGLIEFTIVGINKNYKFTKMGNFLYLKHVSILYLSGYI